VRSQTELEQKLDSRSKQQCDQSWVLLFGLGLLKLIFGGMVFFSRASTILMTEESPEAPSECPILGLT
jgi:hypothetical protein